MMTDRITRRAVRATAVYAVTLALIAAYFLYSFLPIPIGSEARDYVFFRGWVANADFAQELFFPAGANTRRISMLGFALSRDACGFGQTCLNLIQIALLLGCAVLGGLHLHQLLRRAWLVAVAMLLWALSLPVLAAGFWQATQHDKLAFLFAFAALTLGLWAIRRPAPRLAGTVAINLLLAALFVLAINAKEIAFFLPAAAVVQIVLLAPGATLRGRLRAAWPYGLPLAYAVWYMAVYLLRLSNAWSDHVFDGSLPGNIRYYLGALTGYHPPRLTALVALGVLLAIGVWAVLRAAKRPAERPAAAVLLYLAAIAGGSLALVIRARYPADFYLLVTEWGFVGLLAAVPPMAGRIGRPAHWATVAALAALAVCFVLGRVADLNDRNADGGLFDVAHRLDDGYRLVGRFCSEPAAAEQVAFVFARPLPAAEAFFFVRGGDEKPDRLVGAFVCHDADAVSSFRFDGTPPPTHPGQLIVRWNDDLDVTSITRDGRVLYGTAQ